MIEQLQEMEVARQEMKRKAFEKHCLSIDFFDQGFAFSRCKYWHPKTQAAWEMWQAAQEQMLQASTWNDYSLISPAIEGRYQIFINGEQVAADWIDKFGFADPFEGDALRQDLITHWQPLPQPPKQ